MVSALERGGGSPAPSRAIVPLSSPTHRGCAPYRISDLRGQTLGLCQHNRRSVSTTAGARSSTAARTGRHVIDLDPRWRLVIVLAALGVIPLLLGLGWIARRVRDSYTRARHAYVELLLRSSYRGHHHRKHRRHTSTPAGPGRAPDAPGPAGRHSRRNL